MFSEESYEALVNFLHNCNRRRVEEIIEIDALLNFIENSNSTGSSATPSTVVSRRQSCVTSPTDIVDELLLTCTYNFDDVVRKSGMSYYDFFDSIQELFDELVVHANEYLINWLLERITSDYPSLRHSLIYQLSLLGEDARWSVEAASYGF